MKKVHIILSVFVLFFACRNSAIQTDSPALPSDSIPTNISDKPMKVLLINGSPHSEGCTFTALSEVAAALNADGIETEIIQIGNKNLSGCMACNYCNSNGECVFNDMVNEVAEKAKTADGFIFGSPVYYSGMNGTMKSFLDRLFRSAGQNFAYKPGAAVCSARRAGTTATLQQMNQYFTINNMPVASSQYWNMVHGNTPDEVRKDKEGLQIMRTLGHNMAWLLKSIKAGKQAGLEKPLSEKRERTNFIE